MNVPLLHVIVTDDVADSPEFPANAETLLAAGGDRVALHLRLKRASGRDFHSLAVRLRRAVAGSGGWCVINGRADIALTARAEAVQLGTGSIPVAAVRGLPGRGFAIGASVHSAEEARLSVSEGADYLVAGSVFRTASHPDRDPAGVALVTSCAEAGVPVVGVGGIDASNARQVVAAGAMGIAVIRAVWQEPSPVDAALGLLDAVSAAREQEDEGAC